MTIIYYFLATGIVYAGANLMSHLGAETVPNKLKPFANAWVKSGGNPKSVKIALWILFALIAVAVFFPLGFAIYTVLLDMGRGYK
ncbi:MAG: hypothetical protein QOH96_3427 [Blastocatellia bacterium]|jgi:hypothetical protein|nr:hypothetical protein [Blastocatellia bacterium]